MIGFDTFMRNSNLHKMLVITKHYRNSGKENKVVVLPDSGVMFIYYIVKKENNERDKNQKH